MRRWRLRARTNARHDTEACIRHGRAKAGVDRPVFTDAAIDLLQAQSCGLMRRVGSLAGHALLDAGIGGQRLVEKPDIRRAVVQTDA